MSRRARVAAGAAVLLATGGVVAMSDGRDAPPPAGELPPSTATVSRGKLSDRVSVDGVLTYRARSDGAPFSAINQASGTYTALPDAGTAVACGDALYRVDETPVLLLCGPVPAYRGLSSGDEGRDVRQLNRNLRRLGYDAEAGVDIDPGDDRFSSRTEAALAELQDDRGLAPTGALAVGAAVVLPGPGRIAGVSGRLGGPARPGAQVAQATSGTLEVQVQLDPSQQGDVRAGDRAQITLPGNASVPGRVARIGRVTQTPSGQDAGAGGATLPASISLDDPRKARGLDRAPVRVDITTRGVQRALNVPVTALLGKVGGGFAVEIVRADGRRELVAVKLGLFDTAGGRVQVDGELGEGDHVVVPAP